MPILVDLFQIDALKRAVPDPATQAALAKALGFAGMRELTAAAAIEDIQLGQLEDWREAADVEKGPIIDPVDVVLRVHSASIDLFINGSNIDPYKVGASSLRLEREGDVTRFMINDANCDAPYVMGARDGMPLARLADDWEPMLREEEPDDGLEPN